MKPVTKLFLKREEASEEEKELWFDSLGEDEEDEPKELLEKATAWFLARNIKKIEASYPGKCCFTGERFQAGSEIYRVNQPGGDCFLVKNL
jgi:hypothetical protein